MIPLSITGNPPLSSLPNSLQGTSVRLLCTSPKSHCVQGLHTQGDPRCHPCCLMGTEKLLGSLLQSRTWPRPGWMLPLGWWGQEGTVTLPGHSYPGKGW